MTNQYVLVGAVAGAFGVQGEVRLRSFTSYPEALVDYAPFLNEKGDTVLTPKSSRLIKDGIAVFALEVKTREDAMAMRNTKLFVPRDRLPATEEDEYYHVDLVGLKLEALDGAPLGSVRAVIPGPQDLLDIDGTPGSKSSWFLPFTRALVPVVDIANGRLVGDVPDGLIPMIGDLPDVMDEGGKPKRGTKTQQDKN